MAERTYAATLKCYINAPVQLVWALISDTNRFERAAGVKPAHYETVLLREGDFGSRARVARAREYGIEVRWIEPPYEWIEGRHVHGVRKFTAGPMNRADFQVEIEPNGSGTELSASASVTGEGPLAVITGLLMRKKLRKALGRYVSAIERVLAGETVTVAHNWDKEPSAVLVRRALLLLAPTDAVVSGKISTVREVDLAFRAQRFAQAPVDPVARERLLEFLRVQSDEDVAQIRPFDLACVWSMDRREVLRAFLHAARAGLVDLRWQLNCPTCRVAASQADSLAAAGNRTRCDTCNVTFELDFATHVEAVFQVNPSIREVKTELFCAGSPWFRPHVFAQIPVPAGTSREFHARIPHGPMLLRTLQGAARALFDVGDVSPAWLKLSLTKEAIVAEATGQVAVGESSMIAISNETSEELVLLAERAGWNADVVLGSVIASLPDFVDLFATEAPAAGVDLTVGSMTLLFSDLTDSTALYEKLGDARAFAVIQQHFRILAGVTARHRGAVIKTMGDAVMATFTSPVDALAAALEMVEVTEQEHGALGLRIKVGIHEGPCLAVRANDKLDFFGTTVNLAARLQSEARGSQVVMVDRLLAHQDIIALLNERDVAVQRVEASLKGIREVQGLAVLSHSTAADWRA